jgi:hypothetical protein
MTPQEHQTWLLKLLEPPTTYHWFPHVLHRAKQLATYPECAHLPDLVEAEYERIRKSSKANGSIPASTDEPRRNDVQRP